MKKIQVQINGEWETLTEDISVISDNESAGWYKEVHIDSVQDIRLVNESEEEHTEEYKKALIDFSKAHTECFKRNRSKSEEECECDLELNVFCNSRHERMWKGKPKNKIEKPELLEGGDFATYGETNLAKAIIYLADKLDHINKE